MFTCKVPLEAKKLCEQIKGWMQKGSIYLFIQ